MAAEGPGYSHTRMFTVLLVVVVAVSIGGFAVGIRPALDPPATSFPARHEASGSTGHALPSVPYALLIERRNRPDAPLSSNLSLLRKGLPDVNTPVQQTEQQRSEAIQARAQRRAFDGAPPVIPHPIDQQSSAACLSCHNKGLVVGAKVAPVLSHAPYANCVQCHAEAAGPFGPSSLQVANAFAGIKRAGRGLRAWAGAPPTIPHHIWMRESCASCHGVSGRPGIKTTHPNRGNCVQCHVPRLSELPWVAAR